MRKKRTLCVHATSFGTDAERGSVPSRTLFNRAVLDAAPTSEPARLSA